MSRGAQSPVAGADAICYLQVGAHRLEYRWIAAPANARTEAPAPVLVFLHEGLGSTARWKDFPDRVAQATGCAALVYSRYGYGGSQRLRAPRSADYMHREALDSLPDILQQLDIRDPLLIGHSNGASIAIIHTGAGRWPVRGLILMAPHVFVEERTLQGIAEAGRRFDSTDFARRLARYHDDVASTFRGWSDIWLHRSFRDWNIEEYLPGIACPQLLIQGMDDEYGSSAQLEAIARQTRGKVDVLQLPQCGHSPHVDQRDRTLRAIAAFVQRLRTQVAHA